MSIRTRTLSIIVIIIISMLLLLGASIVVFINTKLADLETARAVDNTERVQGVIDNDMKWLSRTAADWGAWDETSAFIQGKAPHYRKKSLNNHTLQNLDINLVIFTDRTGKVVHAQTVDMSTGYVKVITDSVNATMHSYRTTLAKATVSHPLTGVLQVGGNLYLVGIHPIVRSEFRGATQGYLLMGRCMDRSHQSILSETVRYPTTIHPLTGRQAIVLPAAVRKQVLASATPMTQCENARTIVGYARIGDIAGVPVGVLQVRMPRETYQDGIWSSRLFLALLLGVGLAFGLVILGIVERLVLQRLKRLEADVSRVGASGNLSARLPEPASGIRQDEITHVTVSVNGMLDALETAQRRAEEALRASEERLRLGLEGSNVGIWDWDLPSGHITFIRHWAEILGYHSDEIVDHISMWENNVHPDDKAWVTTALQDHLEGRTPYYQTVHRLRAKNGEWRWMLDQGQVVTRDVDGRALRVIGLHMDITNLKSTEDALSTSEQRFAAMFHFLPIPVAIHAEDGRFLDVNAAFERVSGLTRDQVVGHTRAELGTSDDREYQTIHQHLLAAGEVHDFELPMRTQDGQWRQLAYFGKTLQVHGERVLLTTALDVTERKQTEAALCQALEKARDLEMIINRGPAVIFLWRIAEEWPVEFVSENIRQFGYEPAEFYEGRMAWVPMVHPDDVPWLEAQVADYTARGIHSFLQEYRVLTKEGEIRWVLDHTVGRFDANGNLTHYEGIIQDITRQKMVEEALREKEYLLRMLLDTNPNVMFVRDSDGVLVLGNKATEGCYQRPLEELIGHNAQELYLKAGWSEDEVCAWIAEDVDVLAHGAAVVRESKSIHPDGQVHWHRVSKYPATLFDGRECLLVTSEDITERRQAEDALERERAYLDTALEMLPIPLIFFSREWQTVRANTARLAFDERLHTLNNSALRFLDPLTHTDIPQDQWPGRRAMKGEIVAGEEYIATGPSGVQVPIMVYAAPIVLDGEIVTVVLATEDISILKEADRAKDELLAILSHELQTPLTSMLGWAELALLRQDPAFTAQAMEVVHRNARRQQALVKEMLDMSRLVYQKLTLVPEQTDLWQQAQLTVESFLHEAEKHQISLTLEAQTGPLPIFADGIRIQQCIGNLLQNSVKFTPTGGAITVTCRCEGDRAVVSVHDTGRGIAPEALPMLFSLFRQVDRDESKGGLGLGLAVVKGIVALHGGRVWAHSDGLGQGSTFTIELPLLTEVTKNAAPDTGSGTACVQISAMP